MLPESVSRDVLSSKEKEYFTKYNEIITEYIEEVGLDVTSDIEVSHCVLELPRQHQRDCYADAASQRTSHRNPRFGGLRRNHDRKRSLTTCQECNCVRAKVCLDLFDLL